MDYKTPSADAFGDSLAVRAALEAAGIAVQGIAHGAGELTITTDTPIPAELQAALALTEA